MDVLIIIVSLISVLLISSLPFLPSKYYKFPDGLTKFGLLGLIIAMGMKIGADEEVLRELDVIGLKSLLIAVFSVMGSLFCLKLVTIREIFDYDEASFKKSDPEESDYWKTTSLILVSLFIGVLSGLFLIPPEFMNFISSAVTWSLSLLIFAVGFMIGSRKGLLQSVGSIGWKILLIPLSVACGSILGAMMAAPLLNSGLKEGAAVGAGFGWYSLSGVLLTNLKGAELGSIAFLSNVMRELIAILLIPWISRHWGPIMSIAPCGATSMDVTLPVLHQFSGEEIILPAFVSGAVLSGLVPVLVPIIIGI